MTPEEKLVLLIKESGSVDAGVSAALGSGMTEREIERIVYKIGDSTPEIPNLAVLKQRLTSRDSVLSTNKAEADASRVEIQDLNPVEQAEYDQRAQEAAKENSWLGSRLLPRLSASAVKNDPALEKVRGGVADVLSLPSRAVATAAGAGLTQAAKSDIFKPSENVTPQKMPWLTPAASIPSLAIKSIGRKAKEAFSDTEAFDTSMDSRTGAGWGASNSLMFLPVGAALKGATKIPALARAAAAYPKTARAGAFAAQEAAGMMGLDALDPERDVDPVAAGIGGALGAGTLLGGEKIARLLKERSSEKTARALSKRDAWKEDYSALKKQGKDLDAAKLKHSVKLAPAEKLSTPEKLRAQSQEAAETFFNFKPTDKKRMDAKDYDIFLRKNSIEGKAPYIEAGDSQLDVLKKLEGTKDLLDAQRELFFAQAKELGSKIEPISFDEIIDGAAKTLEKGFTKKEILGRKEIQKSKDFLKKVAQDVRDNASPEFVLDPGISFKYRSPKGTYHNVYKKGYTLGEWYPVKDLQELSNHYGKKLFKPASQTALGEQLASSELQALDAFYKSLGSKLDESISPLAKKFEADGLFGDSKWLASRENYSKLFKVLKPAWGKEADWGNDALKVYSESSKKLPKGIKGKASVAVDRIRGKGSPSKTSAAVVQPLQELEDLGGRGVKRLSRVVAPVVGVQTSEQIQKQKKIKEIEDYLKNKGWSGEGRTTNNPKPEDEKERLLIELKNRYKQQRGK